MNDVNAKKFMGLTVVATLVFFLLPALIVIFVDPYYYFHKPLYLKTPVFSGTARYQNAGLINSWLADPTEKIDTILIGTSMSENFPVKLMKNQDGVSILKLTVAGSFPRDHDAIFNKAVRTGHVRHVVWELNSSYQLPDPNAKNAEADFPFFLYSQNPIDTWHYMFNNSVVRQAVGFLRGKRHGWVPLEQVYTWEDKDKFAAFSQPGNLKKLAVQLKAQNHILKDGPPAEAYPNVDQHLLPNLRAHPEIIFQLYFPPISYYQYAQMGPTGFSQLMGMRERVLSGVEGMKNVTVYGFDLIDGIGNDMSNYRDTEHYQPSTNRLIAESIIKNDHLLNLEIWPNYKASLIQRINAANAKFIRKYAG